MKRMLIAGCCVLASFYAVAQDGAPAGAVKKAESAPTAKPEPLDPAVEAWCNTLAKKIVDAQPLVRDSAIAGLERVGKPCLPVLNALASGSDKALAEAAKKLADRISKGQMRGGPGNLTDRIDTLAKEMNLDAAKTQKLKDLSKAAADKARDGFEAVQSGDMTREEFREEMNTYREDMKKELRKFLSEDEAKKVEDSINRGPGMGPGGGGRRGPPGGGDGGDGGGGGRRRPGGGGN